MLTGETNKSAPHDGVNENARGSSAPNNARNNNARAGLNYKVLGGGFARVTFIPVAWKLARRWMWGHYPVLQPYSGFLPAKFMEATPRLVSRSDFRLNLFSFPSTDALVSIRERSEQMSVKNGVCISTRTWKKCPDNLIQERA